ncbi:MAG: Isochorismate synthase MenF [Chlamydiae bacterium]|nr:Isochorismate synthase MenF [Chlamydiota bacterium]
MYNRTLTSPNELLAALINAPFRPHRCDVNGAQLPLMRIEIPIEIDDFLGWLKAQTLFPKIYWENPQEEMKVAAIGCALELDSLPTISAEGGPRFFGGADFMARRGSTWGDFPHSSYILPLIEIEEREGVTFLCINRTVEDFSVEVEFEQPLYEMMPPLSRVDYPSYPLWERNVREILALIEDETLTKVVPARCTEFTFEEELCPYSILKGLQDKSPTATLFAFQFEEERAFIGASPETLYRRVGRRIESAALAGTAPRRAESSLLTSQKELREFSIVKESVERALSPLCSQLRAGERRLLQTATLEHIHQIFEGTLKEDISDDDLIAALHPTPAVGGSPRDGAIGEIARREPFDRGWYAAPVGWVTRQQAHHLVALRSALIENNRMRLFAGAGVVEGSIPLNEWNELEEKISQYFLWEG